MNYTKKYLSESIQNIAIEASNVKHLAKILEELIQNNNGNISAMSIATLAVILSKAACTLSDQLNNLSLRMEK